MPTSKSPDAASLRSKSRTSHTSGTSISVTLPTPQVAAGQTFSKANEGVRGLSPGRHPQFPDQSFPGTGTIPPVGTPTKPLIRALDDQEVKKILAARRIERAWLSYRDRQMFKLLKHAVCAAEHSLSHEILRKVSPKEADLLKDKSMSIRVRFRFGGVEYPPMIFFKVYIASSSTGVPTSVQYVSGKRMIQPASEAAKDACELMGNKKFYEQMIQDIMQHERYGITGDVDVTTLKDYMQYLSLLDETPAHLGGRDNSWRKLTLEVLPRQTVFYDIVDFLYGQEMSPMLQKQLPTLLSRPLTQDIQLQHMRIIATTRGPDVPVSTPKSMRPDSQVSSRRSKQAKQRAQKMKRLYESQQQPGGVPKENTFESTHSKVRINDDPHEILGDDEWEAEADRLYEWTQELSFDELVATPRVPTAT